MILLVSGDKKPRNDWSAGAGPRTSQDYTRVSAKLAFRAVADAPIRVKIKDRP